MVALRKVFGVADLEEKIPMYGGYVRYREEWRSHGVSTLRDEENDAVCLVIDPELSEVSVEGHCLPDDEVAFVRLFPQADKNVGRAYVLLLENWRIDLSFSRGEKRRGSGSTKYRLSRISIVPRKEL